MQYEIFRACRGGALDRAHERGYGKCGERLVECTEDRVCDKFGLVVYEFCARRQRGGSSL
jgi:hypothetical protein